MIKISQKKDDRSKSWFITFPNPQDHGYTGTPAEIAEQFKADWIIGHPTRTCAVAYCVSADGLHHLHAVLEDVMQMRFSKVKKLFPVPNIQETKGSKEQAEAYINKTGIHEEKGEQTLYIARHGEIKGKQGQRRDLDIIEELLNQGMTPDEILDMSLSYRRYEKYIRDAYYRKRIKDTPIKRDVKVYWHWGEAGTGKSHTFVQLAEEHGEQKIYFVGEYKNPFDKYNGEKILILDEFRGQIDYDKLLTILGGYKVQISARYTNAYSLWDDVHITSVFPPDLLFESMIQNHRKIDSFAQLSRRITSVIYHHKDENGNYFTHEIPSSEYTDYKHQKQLAHSQNPFKSDNAGGTA